MDLKSISIKEPVILKKSIIAFRSQLPGKTINWDSTSVWMGNQIQKHFWDHWRSELVLMGFTWPRFLKFMKFHTGDVILWLYDKITWDELISNLIRGITGPLGKAIIETSKLPEST